jgi:hypothetical protein
LSSLTGLVVFIAAVNGAVDNKLTLNKSKEDEAPFVYKYGFSFFCCILSFLMQEFNGIFNIIWYIDYFRKYRYVKKDETEKKAGAQKEKYLAHSKFGSKILNLFKKKAQKALILNNENSFTNNIFLNEDKDHYKDIQFTQAENDKVLFNSENKAFLVESIKIEAPSLVLPKVFSNINTFIKYHDLHDSEKPSNNLKNSNQLFHTDNKNFYSSKTIEQEVYSNLINYLNEQKSKKKNDLMVEDNTYFCYEDSNNIYNDKIRLEKDFVYIPSRNSILSEDISNETKFEYSPRYRSEEDYQPVTKYVIENELNFTKTFAVDNHFVNIGKKHLKRTTSV